MKAVRKLLAALIVALVLVSLNGCRKEDESQEGPDVEADSSSQMSAEAAQGQPAGGGDNQVVAGDTSIGDLISLWDAGKKEQATERFLSIDWQDAAVLKEIHGLSMSERDLVSLSEDDRNSIVQETLDVLNSMRKLFFHVASEAERLAGSGERAKAEEYLGAIHKYGKSLSGPDHLHVVQMHGKAAVGYAEKKLSDLQ